MRTPSTRLVPLRMIRGVFPQRCSSNASSRLAPGNPPPEPPEGIDSEPEPLFLWLDRGLARGNGESSPMDATTIRHQQLGIPLLLPALRSLTVKAVPSLSVATPDDVVDAVSRRYGHDDDESREQFVGGMGESDPGVWFAARSQTSLNDAILFSDLIVQSIRQVKDERHGVPFALCTTGLFPVSPSTSLSELADCVDCLHVSLHASTPKEYQRWTGLSSLDEATRAFGAVCSFISDAVDQGVPVEAWVRSQVAGPSRDLALSLGARNVHAA